MFLLGRRVGGKQSTNVQSGLVERGGQKSLKNTPNDEDGHLFLDQREQHDVTMCRLMSMPMVFKLKDRKSVV